MATSSFRLACLIFLLIFPINNFWARRRIRNLQPKTMKHELYSKYSYPNWKKPLFSKNNNFTRKYSPVLNQHLMKIPLYSSTPLKILNIVTRKKEEKGLTCAVDSVYNELSFENSFDHLNLEHNHQIVYSKLHAREKILVYINDEIHVRILDHIICLRLKYAINPKGGCYQRFAYKNFSPKTINNLQGIRSELLVVTNNQVLTNYFLLLYIDKKIRIISKCLETLNRRFADQTGNDEHQFVGL